MGGLGGSSLSLWKCVEQGKFKGEKVGIICLRNCPWGGEGEGKRGNCRKGRFTMNLYSLGKEHSFLLVKDRLREILGTITTMIL